MPVRTEPHPAAAIIGTLTHELVKINIEVSPAAGAPIRWYGVVVDGKDGWVASDQIRDSEDYHACFARVEGQWLLIEFARGTPRRD